MRKSLLTITANVCLVALWCSTNSGSFGPIRSSDNRASACSKVTPESTRLESIAEHLRADDYLSAKKLIQEEVRAGRVERLKAIGNVRYGMSDEQTAELLTVVGYTQQLEGRNQEALETLMQSLALYRFVVHPRHSERLVAENLLVKNAKALRIPTDLSVHHNNDSVWGIPPG